MTAWRSVQRQPSKLTLSMAAVTAAAAIGIGSAVAVAAPGGPAPQKASLLTAQSRTVRTGHTRVLTQLLPDVRTDRLILTASGPVGVVRVEDMARAASRAAAHRRAMRRRAEQRRAAKRRAAKRRAAQRAAAQRAAAQRAAAQRAAAQRAAAQRAAAQRAAAQRAAAQQASTSSAASPSGSPQQIALSMLGSFGWSSGQFSCLQSLWNRESGWNPYASNPSSGAYGIPQALPGSKMASAGADWRTNPATQIRWGLGYIQQTYGSPCSAWSHEVATGWY